MPEWRYDQVVWGETECSIKRCSAPAELLYDGSPLCLDHADDLLERQVAICAVPSLRFSLPEVGE